LPIILLPRTKTSVYAFVPYATVVLIKGRVCIVVQYIAKLNYRSRKLFKLSKSFMVFNGIISQKCVLNLPNW
jgi:hypothetical protein